MIFLLALLVSLAIVIQAARYTIAFFTDGMTVNGKRVGPRR